MKVLRKEKGLHNQIWVLGKLWNVRYVTENLEADKPVKKPLFYLLVDEVLKKNTDKIKEEHDVRIIIRIIIYGC